jgi:hypothetical protein
MVKEREILNLFLYNKAKCPNNVQYMSLEVEEKDRFSVHWALAILQAHNKGFSWRWEERK